MNLTIKSNSITISYWVNIEVKHGPMWMKICQEQDIALSKFIQIFFKQNNVYNLPQDVAYIQLNSNYINSTNTYQKCKTYPKYLQFKLSIKW